MPTEKKTELAKIEAAAPITQYVNSFVAELKPEVQALIRDNVGKIVEAQMSIVKSRLDIGRCLAEMHSALNTENFNQLCVKVLSKIGISKTTAYRYYSGFKMVHGKFGAVASQVLAMTDGGNSLVKPNPKGSDMVFTPEVSAVLKKMPPIKDSAPSEEQEKWARTFVTLVQKEGRGGAKKKSLQEIMDEQIDSLLLKFGNIVDRVNKVSGAKERRECLDSLHYALENMQDEYNKLAKTINAIPVKQTGKAAKVIAAA